MRVFRVAAAVRARARDDHSRDHLANRVAQYVEKRADDRRSLALLRREPVASQLGRHVGEDGLRHRREPLAVAVLQTCGMWRTLPAAVPMALTLQAVEGSFFPRILANVLLSQSQ